MKKVVLALALAVVPLGLCFAAGERHGGQRAQTWRSSTTATFDTGVQIATGSAIHLRSVLISSPVPGTRVHLFNGYAFAGADSGPVLPANTLFQYYLDVVLSSGLIYTTTGSNTSAPRVDFFWDWINRSSMSWNNNNRNFGQ